MHYNNTIKATFHSRPNRFIANVYINNQLEIVHVKNTGRCKELLFPGAQVILEKSDNPDRKTKYDLVGVCKEGIGLINMDSQAPNKVVWEWLTANDNKTTTPFKNITHIKPECTFGSSRMDFYFEYDGRKAFMEVKGVTLERGGIGYFPDAPTERGIKHLNELISAVQQGYEAYLAFVIQIPGVKVVYPNVDKHKAFADAYEKAYQSGVKVLFLQCGITEDELWIENYSEKEI